MSYNNMDTINCNELIQVVNNGNMNQIGNNGCILIIASTIDELMTIGEYMLEEYIRSRSLKSEQYLIFITLLIVRTKPYMEETRYTTFIKNFLMTFPNESYTSNMANRDPICNINHRVTFINSNGQQEGYADFMTVLYGIDSIPILYSDIMSQNNSMHQYNSPLLRHQQESADQKFNWGALIKTGTKAVAGVADAMFDQNTGNATLQRGNLVPQRSVLSRQISYQPQNAPIQRGGLTRQTSVVQRNTPLLLKTNMDKQETYNRAEVYPIEPQQQQSLQRQSYCPPLTRATSVAQSSNQLQNQRGIFSAIGQRFDKAGHSVASMLSDATAPSRSHRQLPPPQASFY